MTPLLILAAVLGGGALATVLARARRRRAGRRVQTLVWDPASGRSTEVRGRAAVR